jgi:hypothetical protein
MIQMRFPLWIEAPCERRWRLLSRGQDTWQGKLTEGRGVTPSIPIAQPPEQLLAGEDPQMQSAIELAREL